jgi:ubiquinol-cytochrome c reductase iron-sulfur subunit
VANTVVDTDPHAGDPNRRDFIHIAAATAAVGAVGSALVPLVTQMNPSADVLALASIEFDLSKVMPGMQVVVPWQGKPVFVRYRTQKEIDEAVHDDHAPMKDPATDASRHKAGKPQWLILVGVCTHLGCVPNFGTGEYGGWLCPCHGSQYDTAGRIRKGPAPLNLAIPNWDFISDTKVKIG